MSDEVIVIPDTPPGSPGGVQPCPPPARRRAEKHGCASIDLTRQDTRVDAPSQPQAAPTRQVDLTRQDTCVNAPSQPQAAPTRQVDLTRQDTRVDAPSQPQVAPMRQETHADVRDLRGDMDRMRSELEHLRRVVYGRQGSEQASGGREGLPGEASAPVGGAVSAAGAPVGSAAVPSVSAAPNAGAPTGKRKKNTSEDTTDDDEEPAGGGVSEKKINPRLGKSQSEVLRRNIHCLSNYHDDVARDVNSKVMNGKGRAMTAEEVFKYLRRKRPDCHEKIRLRVPAKPK